MEVHGIGPVLSKRIIDYRDRIGGFAFPYQLDAVNGIGPERMEAILRYFCPELYEDPPT
jgi:DNA uptake protein ComE-like DNA-binding protein